MTSRRIVVSWLAVLVILGSSEAARAQNWSFDARNIASEAWGALETWPPR